MSTLRFRCGMAGVRAAKSINTALNGDLFSEAFLVGVGASLGSAAPYLVAAVGCRLLGFQRAAKAVCVAAAFDLTAFDVIKNLDNK